jgi:hypothetical protein
MPFCPFNGPRTCGPAARVAVLLAFASAFVGQAFAASLFDRDEMRESVVRIEVEHAQGTRQGTGFIINDKRTIATNNHVIDGAKSIFVTFLANGKPTAIPARLIATDPIGDMALIETMTDVYGEPVVLGDYGIFPPAQVTAIGYPVAADFVAANTYVPAINFEPSFTVGTVARTLSNTKALGGERLIQHTAPINPGNSGGPLFDACGRVVGINTLRTVPQESDYAQGIFFAVDIRELHNLLEDNVVTATKADKPCTPGMDTKGDLPAAATREAEAIMFDRFAACLKARPCDRDVCKTRYLNRVSTELAGARQGDIDVRMTMAAPNCQEQKEAEAVGEFQRCNFQQPCEFEKICSPKLEEALSADSMKARRVLIDRARSKATADCRAASAPGVWRGAEVEPGIWLATVTNGKRATLLVRCDIAGPKPGSGGVMLTSESGNKDRWTGTRTVRMTVDSLSEPLRLDFTERDANLSAGVAHVEMPDTRGWLKELVGKFSVGSVVTFEEPKVALDETFSLNGAMNMLAPCMRAKFVEQQPQQ